ncbi:MAG TPA: TlpA disulfide reductase family protein [Blastocatellia bacterium]|nr:TlpA disulfide reductase family protein [Blastocatellia bacterium]
MPEDNSQQKLNWSVSRILATVAVVALIAIFGATMFSCNSGMKTASNVVLPGAEVADPVSKTVPPDFDIKTLDGRSFKLSDYRGKVLVVDFWATWCPPCRQEVPQLVRIANQNRARGVEVVGLHIDDRGRSSPDDIKLFIARYDISYTIGMASDEMFVAYLGTEETAIPQTLVFDRKGQAVAHFVGYTEADARRLDEVVNRALAGS